MKWEEILLVGCAIWLAACAVFPGMLWWAFRRSKHPIGRSVGWMALGQTVAVSFACVAGCVEAANASDGVPVWGITVIRLTVGTLAFFASMHLANAMRDIILDYENERENRDSR